MAQHVWSFDIGTGSFGVGVRKGLVFEQVDSLLVPDKFASTESARTTRRMFRTRKAHKAREDWLQGIFEKAGLSFAILHGRNPVYSSGKWVTHPADYQLEREFPPQLGKKTLDLAPSDEVGANTCYCGAVLRIHLLQGRKLAPWQIFKALHSAIQKRGYDADLPWKAEQDRKSAAKDELEKTNAAANEVQKLIDELPDGYQFPCYIEAMRMSLWNSEQPSQTAIRQTHEAESAKRMVFPRNAVELELIALGEAAAEQLPELTGHMRDLLYGPSGQQYASYHHEAAAEYKARTGISLVRGKSTDWDGVLSQKIPTFDNRALSACALIPRFHSAKSAPRKLKDGTFDPDSLLPAEVTFLMKLKNFRFDVAGRGEGRFPLSQICEIYESTKNIVIAKGNASAFKLTKTELVNLMKRHGGVALRKDQEAVESPRISGRSRYSRPALKIVRKLLLSGRSPHEAHASEFDVIGGNTVLTKGLVAEDLRFLHNMKGTTWENFYLPDESLAFVENAGVSADEKIRALIGRQNNPIVRHRLELFWKLLRELEGKHGKPDHIALEFVRDDFMGAEAKMKLFKFQSERRKAREEARKEVGSGKDGLRFQLMKDQGGQCIYCEAPIGIRDLSNCHLDHIVPDKMGGPGAFWNFALCCQTCNEAKGKRTPWQWFQDDHRSGWDAYVSRVRSRTFLLRPKKVRLLTQEDAHELVERYQSLAETAWIARLARTVACLQFGWALNFKDDMRRVVVLPGGLTARVRRKYKLNSLLGKDIADLEKALKDNGDAKTEAEIEKKCRADKRHHALDAMVLSFLPQWTSDPMKRVQVKLPDNVHREFFQRYLENVVPTNLCFEKSVLEESIYGQRRSQETGNHVATKRMELGKLGFVMVKQKPVFKLSSLKGHIAKIYDPHLRSILQKFVTETEPDEAIWRSLSAGLRMPSRNGQGPRVKFIRLIVSSNLKEYKDLSKGDKRPALRKGEMHRGYYVYLDLGGKPRVRPVYAFESISAIRMELQAKMGAEVIEVVGFFQSGCRVTLETECLYASGVLPPGDYILNTIEADRSRAIMTSNTGVSSPKILLEKLLSSGFHRKK